MHSTYVQQLTGGRTPTAQLIEHVREASERRNLAVYTLGLADGVALGVSRLRAVAMLGSILSFLAGVLAGLFI